VVQIDPFMAQEGMKKRDDPFMSQEGMKKRDDPFMAQEGMKKRDDPFMAQEGMNNYNHSSNKCKYCTYVIFADFDFSLTGSDCY